MFRLFGYRHKPDEESSMTYEDLVGGMVVVLRKILTRFCEMEAREVAEATTAAAQASDEGRTEEMEVEE